MQRKFAFETGEHYHVFNRGVEKRTIFLSDDDRDRFQQLLYLTNGEIPLVYKSAGDKIFDSDIGARLVHIVAYALMPNHFHIAARENRPGGMSKFIAKLCTAYSMYFNIKYDRSGPLLCHPFRAKHIDDDDYYRWLLSYIHLNPLNIGKKLERKIDLQHAALFLKAYRYSSYGDYFVGIRPASKILSYEALPFPTTELENIETMLGHVQGLPLDKMGITSEMTVGEQMS